MELALSVSFAPEVSAAPETDIVLVAVTEVMVRVSVGEVVLSVVVMLAASVLVVSMMLAASVVLVSLMVSVVKVLLLLLVGSE